MSEKNDVVRCMHTYDDDVTQYWLASLDNHFILMKQKLNDLSNIHTVINLPKDYLSATGLRVSCIF